MLKSKEYLLNRMREPSTRMDSERCTIRGRTYTDHTSTIAPQTIPYQCRRDRASRRSQK